MLYVNKLYGKVKNMNPLPSGFKTREEYNKYMREYRRRERRAILDADTQLNLLKETGQPISPEVKLGVLLRAAATHFNDAPKPVQDMLIKGLEKSFKVAFEAWKRESEEEG